ncbi:MULTISPECIES: cytochrome c3 family protein [Sphingopyxis]|uniref:cytochrome c3 family protein n=1 Tax=Sphingopyxis TaxID=165697 RepID=UPI00086CD839|nr:MULTISPECIES: cytochrome c3 family protein [Sphingopyxis]APW72138.1 cytochrome C [Sphingopyxis granuli]AVA12891.1 cytochrome C [Sphingopyxis sp. MG]ODU26699.1 MAG: cytochrome C [Sphingopyxis sp. SCN 67-31]
MSFILRRIATTKTGKQIVRDQPLPGDTITLGRESGNGIHIPDLAVNPHHATIGSSDGRHVHVAAQEGLGFDLNGRTLDAADIDSAAGAELRFGGHRLTVAREGDAIVLLVERIDELSQSSKDVDEAKAFSLAGTMPGKRLGAWTFAILVFLAFLAGPIWAWHSYRQVDERPGGYHADLAWSSGPLSSAHKSLKGDCQSCHVDAFVAVTDKACVGCHTGEHKAMSAAHANAPTAMLLAARHPPGVGERILAGFAKTFNRPQGRCVDCHTEHEGAGPMPATPQKFCADCHDGMQARLVKAGFEPTVADAADFGTLHPEFRPLVRTAPGAKPVRAALSKGAIVDQGGLKFPHDLHLQANGGVARMAASFRGRHGFGQKLECANCHRPDADGVRISPVEMERDCAMCHSLAFETVGGVTRTLRHGEPRQVVADLIAYYRSTPPTRPLQLGGMERRRPGQYAEGQVYNIYFREVAARPNRAEDAVRAVFSKGGACYDCHTIFAPAAGNDWRVMAVNQTPRFLTKGWFDHDAHRETDCADCHVAATRSKAASDLLIPGLRQCRDCHVGEGGARLVKVATATESPCAMCHEYHSDGGKPWVPARQRRKGSAAIADRPPPAAQAVSLITGPAARGLYDGTWRSSAPKLASTTGRGG